MLEGESKGESLEIKAIAAVHTRKILTHSDVTTYHEKPVTSVKTFHLNVNVRMAVPKIRETRTVYCSKTWDDDIQQ